jgi:cytochrome P450
MARRACSTARGWVSRYEDVRKVYQNDTLYSTKGAADFVSLVGESFRMIPLAVDPPEHSTYRVLLNPWFSPKAVKAMEPMMRKTINDLIDTFVDKGECDLAYDYGRIYPVVVFLDMMGFPQDMMDEFLSWEYAILHSNGDLAKMQWGIGSAIKYLRRFAEEVKTKPNEKMGSYIVHGKVDGRPVTDDEIIGTLVFLWLGELDTVAATTSLVFRHLAINHDLQQKLRDNPDLLFEAVEEFLRMQPLINSTRLVKEDHVIHSVEIKKGDHIMAFNAAGNFDPAEFEDRGLSDSIAAPIATSPWPADRIVAWDHMSLAANSKSRLRNSFAASRCSASSLAPSAPRRPVCLPYRGCRLSGASKRLRLRSHSTRPKRAQRS